MDRAAEFGIDTTAAQGDGGWGLDAEVEPDPRR